MGEIDVSHETQLPLSCSVLRLYSRPVWLIQSLERIADLVNPIYSFQLECHGTYLALCETLRTGDTK